MKEAKFKDIRLIEEEIKAITDTAKEIFGNNVGLWIFGSRVNPNLKGVDIDIYIEIPDIAKSFTVRKPKIQE